MGGDGVVVRAEGFLAQLQAGGEADPAAAQVAEESGDVGVQHLHFGSRIAQIVADDEIAQARIVECGRARRRVERRTERVEIPALALAGARRRGGVRAGVATRPAEAAQRRLEVRRDHVARIQQRVVGGANVRYVPAVAGAEFAFDAECHAHRVVLVVVDLRRVADAERPALKQHVLAEHVAGVVRRHERGVQHWKARRHFTAHVVPGVAQFGPQRNAGTRRPIRPRVALQPRFHGHGGDLRPVVEAADGAAVGERLQQSAVRAAAGIRHRAAERRHMEAARIAEAAGGRAQPIHLAEQQRTAVEVARGEQE